LVKVRQRQYDAARGAERREAGEALINALLDASTARHEARAYADALALAQRAMVVALVIKSDRLPQATARVKATADLARAAQAVETARREVQATPQDVAARERLVRLLLVDMDAPAEAAQCLEGVADETLLKYVPASAKGVEAAPELACLVLGDWYRGLADGTATTAKAAMLERAGAYYARFLDLHAAQDVDRTKASLALAKVEQDLAKLGAAAGPKGPPWIDLVAKVDLAKDVAAGQWQRVGAGVSVAPVQGARLVLPMAPQGDYEIEAKFNRTSGDDMVGIVLPVGGAQVVLNVGGYHGQASGLEFIKGARCGINETKTPLALVNNRSYTAVVKVLVRGQDAEIAARLDGWPLMTWKGPVASLSLPTWFKLPSGTSPGLVTWGSGITYEGVRLRMLSGEAKPLRPEAPAGKAEKES
jgi:hypothetical protein